MNTRCVCLRVCLCVSTHVHVYVVCACKSVDVVSANKCLHVHCTNAHAFPGPLAQLMRSGIGQQSSCIAGDFT